MYSNSSQCIPRKHPDTLSNTVSGGRVADKQQEDGSSHVQGKDDGEVRTKQDAPSAKSVADASPKPAEEKRRKRRRR